VKRNNKH